ncbi:hypothetical protein BC629DRAFT_1434464 [Irpex lacteus]|nr:hypothetical protein BC629DRAFT_1434464 [Irpex lacteus]
MKGCATTVRASDVKPLTANTCIHYHRNNSARTSEQPCRHGRLKKRDIREIDRGAELGTHARTVRHGPYRGKRIYIPSATEPIRVSTIRTARTNERLACRKHGVSLAPIPQRTSQVDSDEACAQTPSYGCGRQYQNTIGWPYIWTLTKRTRRTDKAKDLSPQEWNHHGNSGVRTSPGSSRIHFKTNGQGIETRQGRLPIDITMQLERNAGAKTCSQVGVAVDARGQAAKPSPDISHETRRRETTDAGHSRMDHGARGGVYRTEDYDVEIKRQTPASTGPIYASTNRDTRAIT